MISPLWRGEKEEPFAAFALEEEEEAASAARPFKPFVFAPENEPLRRAAAAAEVVGDTSSVLLKEDVVPPLVGVDEGRLEVLVRDTPSSLDDVPVPPVLVVVMLVFEEEEEEGGAAVMVALEVGTAFLFSLSAARARIALSLSTSVRKKRS